ncbi:MAG: hypothetical protein LBL90_12710 [Prevotellaceae bacterium]|nr:hypothetical protein [Prevotellaceae bacterium]
MENILLNDTQLLFNRIFNTVGIDAIDDKILKHLAIACISRPSGKSGTVDYLKSCIDEDLALHKIYGYLDRLHVSHREKVQPISVEHRQRILCGTIGLLFYDLTTQNFKSEKRSFFNDR